MIETVILFLAFFIFRTYFDDWVYSKIGPTGVGRKEDAFRGHVILY